MMTAMIVLVMECCSLSISVFSKNNKNKVEFKFKNITMKPFVVCVLYQSILVSMDYSKLHKEYNHLEIQRAIIVDTQPFCENKKK